MTSFFFVSPIVGDFWFYISNSCSFSNTLTLRRLRKIISILQKHNDIRITKLKQSKIYFLNLATTSIFNADIRKKNHILLSSLSEQSTDFYIRINYKTKKKRSFNFSILSIRLNTKFSALCI